MPSGALSPVFLSQEECVAVVDEFDATDAQELPLVLDGFRGELFHQPNEEGRGRSTAPRASRFIAS